MDALSKIRQARFQNPAQAHITKGGIHAASDSALSGKAPGNSPKRADAARATSSSAAGCWWRCCWRFRCCCSSACSPGWQFAAFAYGGTYALSIFMAFYLINRPMNPTTRQTWLILVLLAPAPGSLLYVFVEQRTSAAGWCAGAWRTLRAAPETAFPARTT